MTGVRHRALLIAAARGNDDALTSLVHAYHDRVYRFGVRVCRDSFDADDAVQEAFIKLARRPDVVADRSALSWLMTVVRNACRGLLRPFRRTRQHLGEPIDDDGAIPSDRPDPRQVLERWELVQAVHAGIAALPRSYREVLVMRDLEGLSGEETCTALGLQLATMKTRLHRARAQLRVELRARGVDGPDEPA